jgi:hypothetical protein
LANPATVRRTAPNPAAGARKGVPRSRRWEGHDTTPSEGSEVYSAANCDPDADDGYLTDEEDIARRGGVTADDRVEVQPWIEKEERFSFVSSDPRAIDLDCFKHLAKREG